MKKTSVDDLDAALNDILQDYSVAVNEAVYDAATSVANETVKELRATSPKQTGAYAKGWKTTTAYKGRRAARGGVRIYVHNDKHYRLTHLLEKGHKKRGNKGGRVKAYPHIAQAEEHARKKLEQKIETEVKGL